MSDKFYIGSCDYARIALKSVWKGGVINDDNTLDEDKLRLDLRRGSNCGAKYDRIFSLWSDTKKTVIVAHCEYLAEEETFTLAKLKPQYFRNIARYVDICNEDRGRAMIDIVDFCNAKDEKRIPFYPWTNNKEGVNGFWDIKAWPYLKKFIDTLRRYLKGKDYILSIGNELPAKCTEISIKMTEYLLTKEDVISHGHLHETPGWDPFHDWRKGNPDDDEMAPHIIETWHWPLSAKKIKEMAENEENILGRTPCAFGFDGWGDDPITEDDTYREFKPLIVASKHSSSKYSKFNMLIKNGLYLEVMDHEGHEAARGVSRIYYEIYGKWPENYGKYEDELNPVPEPVEPDPPTPEPTPDPEPEEPKEESIMKNLWDFKGYINLLWKDKALLMWTVIVCLVVFLLGAVSC